VGDPVAHLLTGAGGEAPEEADAIVPADLEGPLAVGRSVGYGADQPAVDQLLDGEGFGAGGDLPEQGEARRAGPGGDVDRPASVSSPARPS
jgi:hypothetical protein